MATPGAPLLLLLLLHPRGRIREQQQQVLLSCWLKPANCVLIETRRPVGRSDDDDDHSTEEGKFCAVLREGGEFRGSHECESNTRASEEIIFIAGCRVRVGVGAVAEWERPDRCRIFCAGSSCLLPRTVLLQHCSK